MKWISIKEKEPTKEFEDDVYTNCTCATDEHVIYDAVYYHYNNNFYHNQDTTHLNPIPATHWIILELPSKSNSSDNHILKETLELLRDLADLQNGAPLETQREEYENTLDRVYNHLNKYE